MQRSEHGYVPVSGHLQRQLALMPEFHRPEMPDFTIHEYHPLMDSSDMTPRTGSTSPTISAAIMREYDGFVILHGTDTMAFTASALSFMLENLGKPVIVTGSQIPLAELRSDGQINLLNALYVAANYPINEVALFFNNRLFRGNRTTKAHADGFDAFASPNLAPAAGGRDPYSPSRYSAGAAGQRRAYRAPHHSAADWRGDDLPRHLRRRGAQFSAPTGESADPPLLWRRQCPTEWRVYSGAGGSQPARYCGGQSDAVHVRKGEHGRLCHRQRPRPGGGHQWFSI